MGKIPVFSFVAFSGMGKTTYLVGLVAALKAQGLRVGVVKHDGHEFEIDREGKDSWRLSRAGADVTAVVSGSKAVFLEQRTLSPEAVIDRIRDVDVILTEGYKNGPWRKIAVFRAGAGQELAVSPAQCVALVSDAHTAAECPVFPLDDPQPMAHWLCRNLQGEDLK